MIYQILTLPSNLDFERFELTKDIIVQPFKFKGVHFLYSISHRTLVKGYHEELFYQAYNLSIRKLKWYYNKKNYILEIK